MSDIGPTVLADLESHGLAVRLVDFPQNTFRDFWGYGRGLRKAVDAFLPRMVMPIGDSLALARLKASGLGTEAAGDVIFAVDGESSIALLDSKVRTYALASSLGIPQPACFGVEALPDPRVQLIFKRDVSFAGSGVHRPRSHESLLNMVGRQNGAPYLIEEYIEGEDLSVDCIRTPGGFRGECYISTSLYSQGPSALRTPVECPEAVDIARKILDNIDYRGVCGMDFRLTPDGRVFLLECNPRFTGGVATQIGRGFDIPWLLYQAWL